MSDPNYWDSLARKRQEIKSRGPLRQTLEWEADDPAQLFAQLLSEHAKDAQLALDLGCGEGSTARTVAGLAGCVVACDMSALALQTAARLTAHPNIHYVQADADAMPFSDSSFDLAYSRRGPALESRQALLEAARVMSHRAVLVGLAVGESHRIETQEIFGRGRGWGPVTPVRFSIPQKVAATGLELIFFSEYYANGYYPDIHTYSELLAATPLIPDFDPEKDAVFLREVERKLKTDRGIRDTEHMAIFIARKPD